MKKESKPFKNMVIYTEKDFEKFKKKLIPIKKETLEEVAEGYWLNDDSMTNNDRISYVNGFLTGAKWQQERMFELMNEYADDVIGGCTLRAKEWFEQFKNK